MTVVGILHPHPLARTLSLSPTVPSLTSSVLTPFTLALRTRQETLSRKEIVRASMPDTWRPSCGRRRTVDRGRGGGARVAARVEGWEVGAGSGGGEGGETCRVKRSLQARLLIV